MKILNIENSAFEELRCTICQNYLVHFPIRVCADGGLICGKCEPECGHSDSPKPHPAPVLETIIKNAQFSCKFEENGCDIVLSWDSIIDHEGKCTYRIGNCMGRDCKWSGLMLDLNKHFRETHKCVEETDIALNINVTSSVSDTSLALVENIPFVVDYSYDAHFEILSYQIRYIAAHIREAKYQIVAREKVLTKGECVPFFTSHNTPKSLLQNVKNISTGSNLSINIKTNRVIYKWCTLDYDKLDQLVCVLCGGYLIPHAYDYQASTLICGSCAEENRINIISKSSINVIITSTYFACKWIDCYFISNALIVFNHQKACRYKNYTCLLNYVRPYAYQQCVICKHQGYIDSMKTHLENVHSYKYCNSEYSGPCASYGIYTVQRGDFVILNFNKSCASFHVTVKDLTGAVKSNTKFAIYVQFEHDHCRVKTKWFSISSQFTLDQNIAPPCFDLAKPLNMNVKIWYN